MTTKGIDIYHDNGIPDLSAAMTDGIQFAIFKATQGASEVDPMYAANKAQALAVGLTNGAYCFFTEDDPVSQAEHLLATAPVFANMIVHVLDVETYFDGVGEAALTAAQWLKAKTGRYPIIYASKSFYQSYLAALFPADDYALWIADYGNEPNCGEIMWQYSESGSVAGISGDVDMDSYYGTHAELLANHCYGLRVRNYAIILNAP